MGSSVGASLFWRSLRNCVSIVERQLGDGTNASRGDGALSRHAPTFLSANCSAAFTALPSAVCTYSFANVRTKYARSWAAVATGPFARQKRQRCGPQVARTSRRPPRHLTRPRVRCVCRHVRLRAAGNRLSPRGALAFPGASARPGDNSRRRDGSLCRCRIPGPRCVLRFRKRTQRGDSPTRRWHAPRGCAARRPARRPRQTSWR